MLSPNPRFLEQPNNERKAFTLAHPSPTRIGIIDSNRMKGEALRHYCAHFWGFDVVAIEHCAHDGIAAASRAKPELILATLPLPQICVREFIARLKEAAPEAKLIILAAQCSEYFLNSIELESTEFLNWYR